MINLSGISKYITGHTRGHICVKGNRSVQNQVINTMAEELRKYLETKRGKKIYPTELAHFYSQTFPNLAVRIETGFDGKNAGVLTQNFDKKDKVKSFIMGIMLKKPLIQLSKIFYVPQNSKLKINGSFVDTIIHESTHLFQIAIKPELQIHLAKIKKLVPKKKINSIEKQLKLLFIKHVYLDANDTYIRPLFSETIKKELQNLSKGNKNLHLAFLKSLIREAQMEKQAFELGTYEKEMFSSRIFKRFKWYQEMIRDAAKGDVESVAHFDDKIKTLKEDYFALAKQIREKRAQKLAAQKTVSDK